MMAGPFYDKGTYHLQILDVALSESKQKEDGSGGNPQIVIRGKVISKLLVNSAGEEESQLVTGQYDRTLYLTVTEKSKEMVLKKLRWAGWHGDRMETVSSDLVGIGCRAVCGVEAAVGGKYSGQLTEKWDLELPPRESTPLENKPAVAKKLNALFGKMLKETVAKVEAPAPEPKTMQEAVAAGGIPENDDMPF